jgi:nucleoside-triphosphatase THEP1
MTSNTELRNQFREASQNLTLQPLETPEALEKFKVTYDRRKLVELECIVDDCLPTDNKIVFTGHRGCGKSTLLREFATNIKDRYFVVFFSMSETIEMNGVSHINILFSTAVQMMAKAQEQGLKIPKSISKKFYEWFGKRTQTWTDTLQAEIAGGFDFWGFLKGKLKVDSQVREVLSREVQKNFSDLIDRLNEIAVIIQNHDPKHRDILVIIDDLDKLDLEIVGKIYRDNVKALFQPKFRMLFTVPIAATRDIPLRDAMSSECKSIIQMSVYKLYDKGENGNASAKPDAHTLDVFGQILAKRIPEPLREEGIVEGIILKSGGVLRDLIRIAGQCCSECSIRLRLDPQCNDIRINQDVLTEALNAIRKEYAAPLGKPDYELLRMVYRDYAANYNDGADERFLKLLHGLYSNFTSYE